MRVPAVLLQALLDREQNADQTGRSKLNYR